MDEREVKMITIDSLRTMTCRTLMAVAVWSSAGTQVRGQSVPDFSGEWTRMDSVAERTSVAAVGDAAFRTGSMGNGWGSPLIMRQQSGRLVIEYTFFSRYDLQAPIRLAYTLDGSESRNALNIGHTESVLRSRAVWRDTTLVITTTYRIPGGGATTTDVRQALTLESPTSLIVETTRTGVPGTNPTVSRAVYTKR
jgi:hypothetical protein